MKATFTVDLVDLEELLAEDPEGAEEGGRLLAASGGGEVEEMKAELIFGRGPCTDGFYVFEDLVVTQPPGSVSVV